MNAAIENQPGTFGPSVNRELAFVVSCDGPADELRALGALCGARTDELGLSFTDAPSGMGLWIGPHDGPLFLLFNRLDHRAPAPDIDESDEVEYAAYVVYHGWAGNEVDTLGQWRDGESVSSGSVTTYGVTFGGCSASWGGSGSFLWRSTTLSFYWSANYPC
jgi:hypothetical protein